MINLIKDILNNIPDINGWKIVETKTESSELFFIKKNLDMNRRKKVNHFQVSIYKDFIEGGEKYRGSSTTDIHPTMDRFEIEKVIKDAVYAAGFVKNKYYTLVQPENIEQPLPESKFSEKPMSYWLSKLTTAFFKKDNYDKGWINSGELFLNDIYTRIINSEGLDVSYNKFKGELEFITNWQEKGEEIELYRKIDFSDYKPDLISEKVDEMLIRSKEKAIAQPTPSLGKHTVLLSGSPVKEFLKYYYIQSGAQYVYEQISTAKPGDSIQGKDIKGDLINMKLDPFIENSTESVPYDGDGFPLKTITIYEDGILKNYWGNKRYSYYLDVPTTGEIKNIVVKGGENSLEHFKESPYLELLAFSDFQMDPLTGNFGGEIRLGRYFDGKKVIPVTGGSISGNIKEVQQELYLSREIQRDNNFIGPETIQLLNVSVSGS